MTLVPATVIDTAGDALGGFLPRLLGALLLLVAGLLLARLVRWVVVRALRAAGFDALLGRWGVARALEGVGVRREPSALVGSVARVVLSVVAVFAALSLLGLEALSASLNAGILLLPKVLVAALLVIAGLVLGELVRERVDRLTAELDVPGPLGAAAGAAVLSVFAVTALAQVGVPTVVLLALVVVALAAAALTFALAFGLGGREVARELNSRRYVAAGFELGDTVAVGDVEGEILAIEGAATVLRAADGSTVRVPNHLLVESVVRVRPRAPEPPTASAPGPPRAGA